MKAEKTASAQGVYSRYAKNFRREVRLHSGGTTGSLQGICPDCDRIIYRRVNPQKLDTVRGDLEIKVTQPRTRIEESAKPNVYCNSAQSDQR